MLRIESPPRAKKLSSTPTRSGCRAPRPRCAASAGLRLGARRHVRGPGVRLRGRRGQRAPVDLAAAWSAAPRPAARTPPGPCSRAGSGCSRTRSSPRRGGVRARWARRRPPAAGGPRVSRATTTASPTSGWPSRAASISPGSMRKPRILTWSSARPRYSSTPSGRPARPVAGAVHPGAGRAERVGDEALARSGPAGPGSRGRPGAGEVQLARHAERHRPQARRPGRTPAGCGRGRPMTRTVADGRSSGRTRRRRCTRWGRRSCTPSTPGTARSSRHSAAPSGLAADHDDPWPVAVAGEQSGGHQLVQDRTGVRSRKSSCRRRRSARPGRPGPAAPSSSTRCTSWPAASNTAPSHEVSKENAAVSANRSGRSASAACGATARPGGRGRG